MQEEKPFEPVQPILPGDRILRRRRKPRRLRVVPNIPEFLRFLKTIVTESPLLSLLLVLLVLWLLFSTGLYFVEHNVNEPLATFGDNLWWSLTAMQTQGFNAPGPITTWGRVIASVWSILGTLLFFGAIVSSVTVYFLIRKPRPLGEVAASVQYNLGRLEELSAEELETLKDVADRLIQEHIDRSKRSP